MTKRHDRSLLHAETEIVQAVRASGSDRQTLVGAVADVVARDLRKSGKRGSALLSAVSALSDAAALAAPESGADAAPVAEGFMTGVMLSGATGDVESRLAVIGHAAGTFVRHARAAGADAAAVSIGLVEGAVAWSAEAWLDAGLAASAAGQGAADAAEDVDPALGLTVRAELTSRMIAGVAVMLKDPVAR